jgi:23S rRNA (guanosine2251-2'-O)-methyltransferase
MLVSSKNVAKEVLKNKKDIKKVYLIDDFNDEEILFMLKKSNIVPQYLDKRKFYELADKKAQGIIIDISDYKYCDLDDIIKQDGLIIILDHLEDPHNFGAIIRTCEAAGVDGIVIPKDRSVEVNSTVMKTSVGALSNIKIAQVNNLNQAIEKLKKECYWIVGTDMSGENYTKIDYQGSICLIIGSEGNGMSKLVRENCDFIAQIPMFGKINSLNASVAAGIMIYEAVRQRKS